MMRSAVNRISRISMCVDVHISNTPFQNNYSQGGCLRLFLVGCILSLQPLSFQYRFSIVTAQPLFIELLIVGGGGTRAECRITTDYVRVVVVVVG